MLHELYIDLWTARAEAAGKCCMPPDHYSADLQMCIVFLANLCTSAFLHVAHVNASRHSQTITFLSCQICCLVLAELSDFSEHNPDGDAGNTNTRLFVAGAGAAPGGHPAAGNDYRAELAQAKRREAEASTRVAALEVKLLWIRGDASNNSGADTPCAGLSQYPKPDSELLTCECVVVLSVFGSNVTGQLSELELQQKM